MKTPICVFVFSLLLLMNGCQREENIVAKDETFVSFKNIRVPVPEGIPSEIFAYKEEDFQNLFYSELKGARVAEFEITLEEFGKYSQPIVDKYPNRSSLSKNDDMAKRLEKDFKHLSQKQLDEQLNTILDYYNQIVKYELAKVLPKVPSNVKAKGGKLASGYFGTALNSCEFWLIFNNSGKRGAVEWATQTALDWSQADFPNTLFQGTGDAFRHALWNALMIQKLSDENYATYEALVFTGQFTTAHECETTDDFDKNMDLHNNVAGYTTYPTLTSVRRQWTGCGFLCWGNIPIFNNPGYDNIRQYYRGLANNAVQVFNVNDIQNTGNTTLVRIQ